MLTGAATAPWRQLCLAGPEPRTCVAAGLVQACTAGISLRITILSRLSTGVCLFGSAGARKVMQRGQGRPGHARAASQSRYWRCCYRLYMCRIALSYCLVASFTSFSESLLPGCFLRSLNPVWQRAFAELLQRRCLLRVSFLGLAKGLLCCRLGLGCLARFVFCFGLL